MNRDTRDGLTESEQSYLHDSFKYTGGGLALTALAARSLFKSGVAFRIMAANPCACNWHCAAICYADKVAMQGPCLVSVSSAALDL